MSPNPPPEPKWLVRASVQDAPAPLPEGRYEARNAAAAPSGAAESPRRTVHVRPRRVPHAPCSAGPVAAGRYAANRCDSRFPRPGGFSVLA